MALAIDSDPPPELVSGSAGRASTMPDSSPSDRGGGWVVAQTVLMVLFVVLVFLPPYWPHQLSFVGIPIALAGCRRLRLVGAFARQVADAVPTAARDGGADREGAVPLRPTPDLRRRAAVLLRRRAVLERSGDDRRCSRSARSGGGRPRSRRSTWRRSSPSTRTTGAASAGSRGAAVRVRFRRARDLARARRTGRCLSPGGRRRGAARRARLRHGDRRGRGEGGGLHARADRQGDRRHVRRQARSSRSSRETGAPTSTRSRAPSARRRRRSRAPPRSRRRRASRRAPWRRSRCRRSSAC